MARGKTAPEFRYEDATHEYFLDGRHLPSITQLIAKAGLVSGEAFMTQASRDRGSEIHRLCANYDLGVVGGGKGDNPYKGYLAAYIGASVALKPKWEQIEEAEYEPNLMFAGRIDRYGQVWGRSTICEIKSAVKAKHHAIQTAMQSLLIAWRVGLPAEQFQRLCIYVKPTGRFSVEIHEDRRDFDVAKDLIRRYANK